MYDSITKIEDGNYIIHYPNKNNYKEIKYQVRRKNI